MASEVRQPRELSRYIGETEKVILIQRRHWVAAAGPLFRAVLGLLVLGWLTAQLPASSSSSVANGLVIAYLVLLLVCVWQWFDFWQDLFIVTNYRLLNLHGIITRKVEMMPLSKVTDMGYFRTPLAKVLGYGRFRLESAGQDQALSTIDFVKHPDETYRVITAQIFKPPSRRATDVRPPPGSGSALPVVEPDDVWWKR